jgi:hypothetical protein
LATEVPPNFITRTGMRYVLKLQVARGLRRVASKGKREGLPDQARPPVKADERTC